MNVAGYFKPIDFTSTINKSIRKQAEGKTHEVKSKKQKVPANYQLSTPN
jgi:hypothetical protein